MSKIVQAVNAMIANPSFITDVIKGEEGDEIFFLYKGKYKWSMAQRDQKCYLWFYPGNEEALARLASYEGPDWEGVAMVAYNDAEIGTKEAKASFSELHNLIKEKVFGVNDALDDIISDADPSGADLI